MAMEIQEINTMYDTLRRYGQIITDVTVEATNMRIVHYSYCGFMYVTIMQFGEVQYVGRVNVVVASLSDRPLQVTT